MLSLTRKADYAILATAELARRGANRVSARELAEHTRVPLPMLTNVLHQLLHHGLVTSAMGSKGGYRLARAASEITLAELIGAIEGQFRLAACCDDEPELNDPVCDLAESCQIKGPVKRVHDALRGFLGDVTLAQIAFDHVAVGGVKEVDDPESKAGTTVALE